MFQYLLILGTIMLCLIPECDTIICEWELDEIRSRARTYKGANAV